MGIFFLVFEIRQTTNAIVGASYQSRALAMHDRDMLISDAEFLTPAIIRWEESGYEALSPEDQRRIFSGEIAVFHRIDSTFYQYELGLLSDDYYETVFAGEMQLWVPRWRNTGVLNFMYERGYVRPSFDIEIQKRLDGPLIHAR